MLCPIRLAVDALSGSPSPIDLDLVKTHCAIDGTDLDTVLDVYLPAAIHWAEGAMHRTIFSRWHKWVLRDFNNTGRYDIRLPRGKTQSIQSIQYSLNGSLTMLTGPSSGSPAGMDYQEDLRGDDGGIVMPARGGSWPTPDDDVPAPVVINFTAGWLDGEIPSDVIHALLFAVDDAVELRSTADFNPAMISAGGPRFEAREALISPYRLVRWF